jgi:hypothetical protein
MKTAIRFAAAWAILGLWASSASAQANARTANDLKQIGLAYHMHIDATGKPPAKAEDLAAFLCNNKRMVDLLKNEDIVFFYGVGIAQMTEGTSKTILAYDKEVPDKGGLVLMGDGSVQKVSAAEFKNATKAGKVKEKAKDKEKDKDKDKEKDKDKN